MNLQTLQLKADKLTYDKFGAETSRIKDADEASAVIKFRHLFPKAVNLIRRELIESLFERYANGESDDYARIVCDFITKRYPIAMSRLISKKDLNEYMNTSRTKFKTDGRTEFSKARDFQLVFAIAITYIALKRALGKEHADIAKTARFEFLSKDYWKWYNGGNILRYHVKGANLGRYTLL